jgi:hypothetical protein
LLGNRRSFSRGQGRRATEETEARESRRQRMQDARTAVHVWRSSWWTVDSDLGINKGPGPNSNAQIDKLHNNRRYIQIFFCLLEHDRCILLEQFKILAATDNSILLALLCLCFLQSLPHSKSPSSPRPAAPASAFQPESALQQPLVAPLSHYAAATTPT